MRGPTQLWGMWLSPGGCPGMRGPGVLEGAAWGERGLGEPGPGGGSSSPEVGFLGCIGDGVLVCDRDP